MLNVDQLSREMTRRPRLRLAADGMTAPAILEAIAQLAERNGSDSRAEVVVDVTNAWSIPWTTQAIRMQGRDAYVRHKGFRWSEHRTEAVYEVAAA